MVCLCWLRSKVWQVHAIGVSFLGQLFSPGFYLHAAQHDFFVKDVCESKPNLEPSSV